MREIRFYRTPSGNCPVEEFLDSLTGKVAQKVLWVMQIIEELKKYQSITSRNLQAQTIFGR